ncbi:MAG: type 4a pilus biogenesis protein PilO [Candidatus Omnitrophica bacterium]|nr:type 4a pilus biogenesis protein PilO [Candidatus Omnitrophota bacterium]
MGIKNIKEIVNAFILIIGIIVSLITYNLQKNQNTAHKKRLEMEKYKSGLLNELLNLEDNLKKCRKILKIKDTSELMGKINQLAERSGAKVLSIKPEEEDFAKKNPFYTKSTLRLILEAGDYHALGNFIAQLESDEDLYKIESLTIKPSRKKSGEFLKDDVKIEEITVLKAEMVIIRFNFKG